MESEHFYVSLTKGNSMRPMLREHRDVVIIDRVTEPLQVGQCYLFRDVRHENQYVLHRLVDITPSGKPIFRGDHNFFTERHITPQDIDGILVAFVRNGRRRVDCRRSLLYRLYVHYVLNCRNFRRRWYQTVRPWLIRQKRKIFPSEKD